MKKMLLRVVALMVAGAALGGGLYVAYPIQVTTLAGMAHNYLLSWSAPPGATTTELNAPNKAPADAPEAASSLPAGA